MWVRDSHLGGVMNWSSLFLSAYGRIGRQNFWIAWVILFAIGFVGGFIPLLNALIGLVLIYPKVCIYSKRLHDLGRSGWLQVIPWAVGFVCAIAALVFALPAIITFATAGAPRDPAAVLTIMSGMGLAGIFILIACLVSLAFWLWVGIAQGQSGDNIYGPDPQSPATADTFI